MNRTKRNSQQGSKESPVLFRDDRWTYYPTKKGIAILEHAIQYIKFRHLRAVEWIVCPVCQGTREICFVCLGRHQLRRPVELTGDDSRAMAILERIITDRFSDPMVLERETKELIADTWKGLCNEETQRQISGRARKRNQESRKRNRTRSKRPGVRNC